MANNSSWDNGPMGPGFFVLFAARYSGRRQENESASVQRFFQNREEIEHVEKNVEEAILIALLVADG